MMFSKRRSRKTVFAFIFISWILFLSIFAVTSCRKAAEEPGKILESFFNLLDDGKYRKAAALCAEDIDPDLLDFTYIVSLRFMDKVITKEHERAKDKARYRVYLILKDGKELVYYARTSEGRLLPGSMLVKNVAKDSDGAEWKVQCDEFWERHHWEDITQKIRLTIISVVEQTIEYRDSAGMLPDTISQIWGEALDTIINPVTGEANPFVARDKTAPGVISFYLDKELNELNIKGYDVLGEEIEYYIVSHEPGTEKAGLLEFFDVPPRKLSMVIPAYPESEQEKGVEGIVGLNLLIGRDGMVHEVKVEKSVSPVFDSLAVDAVMQSIFSPAKRDGKPVAVWYQFPVRFVLEE
jgi:TonB family protein